MHVKQVVVVDFHADTRPIPDLSQWPVPIKWVPPKPTVWQGPYRRTARDYFCGANARNTAICHAPDGWIAFVDDLSVLQFGWLMAVQRAMKGRYVVAGAYRKVNQLVVMDGQVIHWKNGDDKGLDTRWHLGRDDDTVPIGGGQLYGCSFAAPLDALLEVNGFDEDADCVGLGSEDYLLGLMLEANGYQIRYDRRMMTFESDERHGWEPPMKRVIEHLPPRQDASWELLRSVQTGRKRAINPMFTDGIANLRRKILDGGTFPSPECPTTNWYSGRSVNDY